MHHTATMANINKTQAMRLLDTKRIDYTPRVYDASRDFHSAEEAAALLGAAVETVYKTLVILREAAGRARPLLVMAPSHRRVDLKLMAKSLGEKKLRMATQREAERLTGLQAGGISALALLDKGFDVLLDETARALERIHISAGQRGTDVELRVDDLVALTGANYVEATTRS
jgi:Cys-tRNA(Pro)/Cys-tRNA(Cys) deacylase